MNKVIRNVIIMLVVAAAGFVGICSLHKQGEKNEPVWAVGDQAVEWPRERLPLEVWMEPSFDVYKPSLARAVKDMNSEIGCKLFSVGDDRDTADVLMLSEGTEKPSEVAGAWLQRTPKLRGEVHVSQPGDVTEAYLIFEHELGHVVGLTHDGTLAPPDKSLSDEQQKAMSVGFVSVMVSNVSEHAYRLDVGLFLPKLTPKDATALRARYCTATK